MKIILIRHAKTDGNKKGRYIGVTDELLAHDTRIEKTYPKADAVVSSPLMRCVQTAKLIYPRICQKLISEDLKTGHMRI